MRTARDLMGLHLIRMLRGHQRLAVMARLPAIGLGTGLPQAFRPLPFAIAVARGRFTAVAAALGQTRLPFVQDGPLLRQLLSKLGHLGCNLMEQGHDRRFALCKGGMDFFIGRHVKIHGKEHKLHGPCCATFWDLSSYCILSHDRDREWESLRSPPPYHTSLTCS